ncbi:MAG: hypothetical protein OQK50_03460 [Deltaproteobacteria bacterium]|jgi:hypothetical protein|nr:hypothetical protein [Deltaproteobacteria bacterium]MCW8893386.1 hypothetical protein [Deltaproteobacteria bacterium]MCW9049372.1 hypothetical protein [Deltaproteobacteria bacterium]
MIGFFFIGFIIVALVVILGAIKQKNGEDNSRIVNASWLDSDDKFHLISRWGAQY